MKHFQPTVRENHGTLYVHIPKDVAEEEDIRKGDVIDLDIRRVIRWGR